MKVEVLADPEVVARKAAAIIAGEARDAVAARGRFVMALSGGRTPWLMLRELAAMEIPWPAVHVVQVDERVAPAGHVDRNLTHLRETLQRLAGSPAVLDLVHLGLGPDGHTASLVPGDPALEVENSAVALSCPYQGRRRMTLTYPILNRARRVLWVVTGKDKADMVTRLLDGDDSIPAGRVGKDRALLLADQAAAHGQ
jgi:6-phosphogluconolactonase